MGWERLALTALKYAAKSPVVQESVKTGIDKSLAFASTTAVPLAKEGATRGTRLAVDGSKKCFEYYTKKKIEEFDLAQEIEIATNSLKKVSVPGKATDVVGSNAKQIIKRKQFNMARCSTKVVTSAAVGVPAASAGAAIGSFVGSVIPGAGTVVGSFVGAWSFRFAASMVSDAAIDEVWKD